MLVTTSNSFQGYTIVEYSGILTATDEFCARRSAFRSLDASVVDERKTALIKKLVEDAEKLGANGVIGLSFSLACMDTDGDLFVSATATAVHVDID